mgnify:CR=1 FL=1
MATQAGFDPNTFGPFGAAFQTYLSALGSYGQRENPFGDLPGFEFDPQKLASQMTGPVKAVARCQLEVLGLINRRTQAYLQIPERFAQCHTPQDLLNERMAFWRTAMEQYAESSRKIAEDWMQIWSGFAERATRGEHDYISISNTAGSKDFGTPTPKQDPGGKQRRVA